MARKMYVDVYKRKVIAIPDNYIINDLINPTDLEVLDNDTLGVELTTITSINTVGFTLGTVIIKDAGARLEFTPNGILGESQLSYTITDSESDTSETIIIIQTI